MMVLIAPEGRIEYNPAINHVLYDTNLGRRKYVI